MVQPPHGGGGPVAMAAPSPIAGPSTTTDSPGPSSKKQSKMPAVPGTLNGPPSGNNHSIPLSARRAEALDLNSVERRGQPNMRPYPEKRSRLFDIPNAPIYRPTEEEFRDPMEYMRKIAPEGSKYGIVKIVPPQTWNPSFAINTERFHFRTRRQELNSVEGGNRVNNDYLDQLAKFHKQNGHNLNRFPSVDKRPLDLYRLKKTVERKGGFEAVCKGKRWAEVGRDLGYSGKIMSSLSTSLKNSYQKWLLPYEEYLRVAKPGVHQQLEIMNGGPYTPSPGPSPVKRPPGPMPGEHAPIMQASAALHASLGGPNQHPPFPGNHEIMHPVYHRDGPPSQFGTPQAGPSQPPSTGGFTPVNAGGFTPVNAQPPPPGPGGFTAVNGVNGMHHSNNGTPQRTLDSTPQQLAPQHIAPTATAALKRPHSELTPDEVSSLERRSKRLRKDVPTVAGSNMHHSRMGMKQLQANRERGNYSPGEVCENCLKPDEPHKQLKCESCGDAYHMYCLEPPLKQAPPHEWHCPRCLVGTNEYGFDEGDVYSLSGFQRKANEFKMHHFNTMPRQYSPFNETKHHLTEDDVEREFWRLVEDISDTTEVEYGADIHSTTHGSGFPTIEKHPRDPYSTDPWNLNIMPLDKESLFRHIKSDVSGMTVPWLYVGMIFSTFCWHNEDHYTYSANYQHFGETKTWYGIPGEDSYKFEEAMKKEVPELFETQPDLLFQLVTLARPEKLRRNGVRVYAIDQHAGEFVITFPRAYHAGFNQGFNFNEAVNFAPHDWEPYGEEGVRRLRDYRKQPCFSHDEMLLTAASRDNSIRTSKWLAPALERMRDEELSSRQHFIGGPNAEAGTQQQEPYTGPRYVHEPATIDATTEEEEVICTFCKAYCHLSRYICKKTKKVLCLLHAGSYECCDALESERYSGQNGEHAISYRMTDDALTSTVQKVVDKANIPEAWAAKVDKELDDSSRPSLKHLRTLLTEGDKIQFDLPQLPDLRRFVERCNEWVEEATNYITRKQTNRRKSEKVWRKGTKAAEQEERDRELRKISNIYNLLDSADKIGFDCPEIVTLRERASNIEDFQKDANAALGDILAKKTEDFEELLERAKDFHVDMPEIESIEKVLKRLRWNDAAKAKKPNADTQQQAQTLKDIEKFLAEGSEIGVPDTNPDIIFFKEHKAQGELWEQKAKELMAVEQVHYQQLDALSRQASTLPVTPETLAAVDAILKKQREIQDKIASLVERSKDPDFRKRPHYNEMKEVMDALDELQSKPSGTIDLEKESKRHEDWMRRGKKLFGKANAPLHILQQHMNQVDVRNQSCFDIEDKPRGPVEPSSRAGSPIEGDLPVTEGSTSSRDVFCICRKSEAGMMIECEICHEWYHGKCLKIARGKVKEDDKYTCPICDWRVKIPRDAARPKLEDLQSWFDELETLPFQPVEEKTLSNICEYGQVFRDFVRPYVEPAMEPTPEEVSILRFYLRKVEGADILLAQETNYLRQQLHRLAKVAPEPPPMTDASHSTRKPRPTKQQKLMAQLGITNPDDLPTQYKMKPHVAKRKQSDVISGMPLQPTMNSASPPGSTTPGLPGSSHSAQPYPSGLTPVPQEKVRKHLTALAIQVLGTTAGHPIVDEFLAQEPHANRDRLLKVKAVLELSDASSFTTDLDTFKTKVNSMPMPAAHTPGIGYETPQERHLAAVQQRQNSQAREQSIFPNASNDMYQSMTSQPQQRLGSPAMFHGYSSNGPSPPPPGFGSQIFGMNDMFSTPTTQAGSQALNNGIRTSPDFGNRQSGGTISSGMPGGMFESPKQPDVSSASATGFITTAGINSPGFGGSQQSAGGNMDNVFADLVHETDDSFGVSGLDNANDVRESKELATSAPSATSGDVEMKDTTESVEITHQLDEQKQEA
ncbi:Putative ARID DNA-binding domain, Zinc finger, PHD-type, JmjC domain, JmjN domain-containing protein [Septoria linicola]|uniref:ARID DNA-binding domain, Zinc finger, PHD-type, JmjC domain, JmjN domain-containing protein n=1 Tax=Septoria linicola TaxID=215465 RepID=A0A9Q9AT98_9PEZI|nr:Putative ARID DNA-binding domain, Zinc finger, PHD-type, JmjC domain, JmjN domain-containing protein [Septoria linicola]